VALCKILILRYLLLKYCKRTTYNPSALSTGAPCGIVSVDYFPCGCLGHPSHRALWKSFLCKVRVGNGAVLRSRVCRLAF
jgi:hypothetical protein